jgi:hypothetical protein
MSSKIDFTVYIKGTLNRQLATLLAADDVQGAQNVQRFLRTSDHIHDGYFGSIAPAFEPIPPKLMLAVQTLNNAIVTGTSSPANFNEYALAVLAALQA